LIAGICLLATMGSAMPVALSILRALRRPESDGLIGIGRTSRCIPPAWAALLGWS
jgi:hypothetical protein